MTSQVNPYNIDGTYPVAGQDNDSEGFRVNFTNTRNNFAFVKAELEDLQAKAVLKSALNNTTLDNDLSASGTTLNNVQLTGFSETFKDNGTVSGSQTISFMDGNIQKITTGGSLTIGLTDWPAVGTAGRLLLWVSVTSTGYTVTLPSQVTLGFPTEVAGSTSNVITFDATGDYLYEFLSTDNGANFFVTDLTRSADKIHGPLEVTGAVTADTTLAVTGNTTIGGNLITNGGKVENGYQYSAATTGFTMTVTPDKSIVVLDPAGTIATGTITLPTGNVDARTVSISSTATVTALTVNGNTGTTVKPAGPYTLSAGTAIKFFYHAVEGKWYKIQ